MADTYRKNPEILLLLWGGLINFVWEMLQAPLYSGHTRHLLIMIWECFLGAVGDCFILLAAFWITSLLFRTRRWPLELAILPKAAFVAIGLAYTIFSKWYHTRILDTWEYGPSMPLILGIGLAPLAQWMMHPRREREERIFTIKRRGSP